VLISKLYPKRSLTLALAAGLALSGTVALAGNSDAATSVGSVKLTPAVGSVAGGTVVVATGKGFATSTGASKIGFVWFEIGACAVANKAINTATTYAAISETKVTATTPALAPAVSPKPTVYNMCIANAANTAVLATGKFTSYVAPRVNNQTALTEGFLPITGSSVGGTTLTITGENFTAKTTVTIGGEALVKPKVVLGAGVLQTVTGGDDTITGKTPPGTSATAAIVVTSEGGVASPAAVGTFAYVRAITVSPSFGNGAANNSITVTGTGFNALNFVPSSSLAAIGTSVVLVPAKQSLTANVATPAVTDLSGFSCGSVQRESDTSLSCLLPAIDPTAAKAGGYTVVLLTLSANTASAPITAATSTGYSNGAAYSVAVL
jgi:hypothetical protein